MNGVPFNRYGVWAIYRFEMARFMRTLVQSVVTPVITTSLYFVVFGSAIGARMSKVEGVPYGAFIVPGLIMLSLFTASISNASFGIYFPKFTGTIYELLSAPISFVEMIIGYVGAAATKSIFLGLVILATATLFVPVQIRHPAFMIAFLLLTATTFSLFGFVIGIWAKGFEQLQLIPMLIVTPLTFLGGAFYLHRHAPADLAHGRPLQPRRLPHQRLPLELLRRRRRRRARQPGHDPRLPARPARRGRLDLQDRLPPQELTRRYCASISAAASMIAQRPWGESVSSGIRLVAT
jgi:ABC-2 type transport system permease protein